MCHSEMILLDCQKNLKRSTKHKHKVMTLILKFPRKKQQPKNAEDTNKYDLTQVEVIDVDKDHPIITDPRKIQWIKVGTIVWKKYSKKQQILRVQLIFYCT